MSDRTVNVAVIEDDSALRDALVRALRSDGYVVAEYGDAANPNQILEAQPDLALIDIGLVGGDGLTLARWLRDRRDVPVVFVTARDAIADRLAGFDLGAEDYIVKPFAMEELLARVRAVLRRAGKMHPPRLAVSDLLVDEETGAAIRNGQPLRLTPTEFRLLVFMLRNKGRVLSKVQLLTQVWGYDEYDPNLVEVHVSALRRKLEEHGPRLIHTVPGLGYKVTAP
jgi:DNA-binding response OmpR family regulator